MPKPIVAFNEYALKSNLRELVRGTVEDTLNGLRKEAGGFSRRPGKSLMLGKSGS